jgi:hypothetical protein
VPAIQKTQDNPKGMYSFDTSVCMDWQARYYPPDVFVSLVEKIDGLIASGQCAAVELVKEEIDAVGTPDLRAWAKGRKFFSSRLILWYRRKLHA